MNIKEMGEYSTGKTDKCVGRYLPSFEWRCEQTGEYKITAGSYEILPRTIRVTITEK